MLTEKPNVSPEEHACIIRAKQEWEQTFDAVSDLVFITDVNHTIVRANRPLADRYGCTPMELVGHKCFEVMHGLAYPPDDCPHARLLESNTPQISDFETDILHGIFEVTLSPVRNAEGQVTATVHVARDVTEKRRSEALFAAQQRQLEEINNSLESRIEKAVADLRKKDILLIQQSRLSAMGDLINSIAHHWRQPLNNIGLIVQSLQLAYKSNDLSVEELDKEIAETMVLLQQISDTIDDFRNFFNYDKEPNSFSVNYAVTRSINLVMPLLKNKGIRAVCDEQSDISVIGYPNAYSQALLNIIVNAKEALQESQETKPLISIRIFEENGRSVVTVLDNGGGIDEDVLPHIFDPYFTTRGQNGGTGIGLYMSKIIIEKNMNGRLSVRNIDGGAEFRIEL